MSSHTIRQRIGLHSGLVLVLMMLMACSGGGSGGGGGDDFQAGGGIGGTGISIGTISGFGSVIVNDDHFSTEDTEVLVNGELKGVGDSVMRSWLAKGMVVRVEAGYPAAGGAIAERIVFTGNLNGPVQSITATDSVVKILSILGQTVILDGRTQPKDPDFDFDDIKLDNVLEISGWIGVGGQIQASYVNKVSDTPDPNAEQMIKGNVTVRNEFGRWFYINQLKIDMSRISDPVPQVSQLVIVHGFLDDSNNLVASKLEIENELGVENADSVEIEGIVARTSVLPADDYDFILGTTKVQTDDATEFVGLTLDDIIPGARLLVKGALLDGVLLADEVKAKDKVDIEGSVAAVDRDEQEITLRGLSPLVVSINSATKIFGEARELNEIIVGQHVKILGYAAGVNRVAARQVKVNKNIRPKVKLQGPIGEPHELNISIFGIVIDTAQMPDNAFYTAKDGNVSRSDFLMQIAERDTVNLMGNLDGDSVEWKEIELLDFEN